jgi:hypothetical protein
MSAAYADAGMKLKTMATVITTGNIRIIFILLLFGFTIYYTII